LMPSKSTTSWLVAIHVRPPRPAIAQAIPRPRRRAVSRPTTRRHQPDPTANREQRAPFTAPVAFPLKDINNGVCHSTPDLGLRSNTDAVVSKPFDQLFSDPRSVTIAACLLQVDLVSCLSTTHTSADASNCASTDRWSWVLSTSRPIHFLTVVGMLLPTQPLHTHISF